MKKMIALSMLLLSSLSYGANLNLEFSNTGGESGTIRIAIFDNATDFSNQQNGKPVLTKSLPISGQSSASVAVTIPNGDYAISAYLDKNNNGKLDTKLGIPAERFGFSNNPPIKFGAPGYSECEFKVDGKAAQKIIFKKML
jgi:uncharacterized protein (DUF2141 family)